MNEHLKWLGKRVKSMIYGLEGIVTSVSFDLNGCIMGCVNPGLDKDGKAQSGTWVDLKGLEILIDTPIYAQPDFVTVPGPHLQAPK